MKLRIWPPGKARGRIVVVAAARPSNAAWRKTGFISSLFMGQHTRFPVGKSNHIAALAVMVFH